MDLAHEQVVWKSLSHIMFLCTSSSVSYTALYVGGTQYMLQIG